MSFSAKEINFPMTMIFDYSLREFLINVMGNVNDDGLKDKLHCVLVSTPNKNLLKSPWQSCWS